jgi:hypothetical protein
VTDVLKKGVEKERLMKNGDTIYFGTDEVECQYYIKLKEIDPVQFGIKNINGNLCIVDTCKGSQLTRIKVQNSQQMRMNNDDYFNLGFEIDIQVVKAVSESPIP